MSELACKCISKNRFILIEMQKKQSEPADTYLVEFERTNCGTAWEIQMSKRYEKMQIWMAEDQRKCRLWGDQMNEHRCKARDKTFQEAQERKRRI